MRGQLFDFSDSEFNRAHTRYVSHEIGLEQVGFVFGVPCGGPPASRRDVRLYPISARQARATGRVKFLLGDGDFPVQDETKNSRRRAGQNQREQANRPLRQRK